MKHVLLLAVAGLLFCSCVAEEPYTCECVGYDDQGNADTTSTTMMATPENIDSKCDAESISSDSTTTCNYY